MRVKFNIKHMRAEFDDVLVYGLTDIACSACAVRTARPEDVATAVSQQLGVLLCVADVADYRPGPSSPTSCEHDIGRHHWFLVYHNKPKQTIPTTGRQRPSNWRRR